MVSQALEKDKKLRRLTLVEQEASSISGSHYSKYHIFLSLASLAKFLLLSQPHTHTHPKMGPQNLQEWASLCYLTIGRNDQAFCLRLTEIKWVYGSEEPQEKMNGEKLLYKAGQAELCISQQQQQSIYSFPHQLVSLQRFRNKKRWRLEYFFNRVHWLLIFPCLLFVFALQTTSSFPTEKPSVKETSLLFICAECL